MAVNRPDTEPLTQYHVHMRGSRRKHSSFSTLISVWNNRLVVSSFCYKRSGSCYPNYFKNNRYFWQPGTWLPAWEPLSACLAAEEGAGFLSHPCDAWASGPQHRAGPQGTHLLPQRGPMSPLCSRRKGWPLGLRTSLLCLQGGRSSPRPRQGEGERRIAVITSSWSPVVAELHLRWLPAGRGRPLPAKALRAPCFLWSALLEQISRPPPRPIRIALYWLGVCKRYALCHG